MQREPFKKCLSLPLSPNTVAFNSGYKLKSLECLKNIIHGQTDCLKLWGASGMTF